MNPLRRLVDIFFTEPQGGSLLPHPIDTIDETVLAFVGITSGDSGSLCNLLTKMILTDKTLEAELPG